MACGESEREPSALSLVCSIYTFRHVGVDLKHKGETLATSQHLSVTTFVGPPLTAHVSPPPHARSHSQLGRGAASGHTHTSEAAQTACYPPFPC